jgi:hypothetical protein
MADNDKAHVQEPNSDHAGPVEHERDQTGRVPLNFDELWLSSLFRPFLISLLIGCINVAFVGFLRHIMPTMPVADAQLLVLLGVVSSLVAGYTTTHLIRPDQRDRRTTTYRTAEIALLLFLTRVLVWAFIEGWPSFNDILYHPVGSFLSGAFVIATILVLLSWGASAAITGQFLEMALRPDELMERPSDRYRTLYDSRIRSDRRSLLVRFTESWIAGGVLLLLFTAGSQVGPSSSGFFALSRQNIEPVVIGAAVVYFLTGFILIAMARLAILRAQWQIEEVATTESIIRNWPIYVVGLVAFMGVVAALLPLGGTFWLARILGAIIQGIYFVIYLILGLFMALLTALLPQSEEVPETPEAAPMAPPPIMEAAPPGVDVAPWLGGALFWTFIVLLLGYAAYIYLSGKGIRFDWLKNWWQMLRLHWLSMWGAYTTWRVSTFRAEDEEETTRRETGGWRSPFSWLRLRGMSPTQRVRYYYLSTLEQAAEHGVRRRPGETPLRYAPRLDQQLKDEEQPVTELTEEFVRIEYAAHQAEESSIPRLQRLWERIRKAIDHKDSDESIK